MNEHEGRREDALVVDPDSIENFSRGSGVVTTPYVGRWNSDTATVTTGITAFPPRTGIPLHSHNVEETVLILEGTGTAQIGDDLYPVREGDATWVPAGVPHRFENAGEGRMRIYWVYGGAHVTRTTTATGRTVVHLSAQDRSASSRADPRDG
jgi:HTH-type transcriptional repressor of puuD